MKLVEFLRARLAEDEAKARAALSAQVRLNAGPVDSETGLPSHLEVEAVDRWHAPPVGDVIGEYEASVRMPGGTIRVSSAVPEISARDCVEHIASHDPVRVLREVEAKRRIVGRHTGDHMCPKPQDDHSWIEAGETVEGLWPCGDLLDLARSYADHPEYDLVWGQGQ